MKNFIRYYLCGLAMGAADTVPGVSGGTIAFITGIYTHLLNAIQAFDLKFFKLFFKGKFKQSFARIPWSFGIPLVLGIGTAIFSLAKTVVYFMETHPDFIWAFFFGLIVSSLVILIQELKGSKGKKSQASFYFIIGALFALWITFANPVALSHSPLMIFFSGFIAICAMILPGISGSFILVLLGQYKYIMGAISSLDLGVLFLFWIGAVCGLLSFSRLVSYFLKHHYGPCLAFLSGILAGSLAMLWPYNNIFSIPFTNTVYITLLVLVGLFIPLLLHRFSKKI